ncbi:MAG: helix-turn-helix transcriptional regulator [Sphingobium sp.]
MTAEDQRKLLGQFVRSHRERIPPDVHAPRRRTPGLRREELAARAGIGISWCAWIEQGRDISVSPHTLARLADALALTSAERAYLFELAGRRDLSTPQSAPITAAPDSILALVHTLPYPAYGLDRLWNACCWNDAAEHLFPGWLDAGHDRNLLRFTFLSPLAKTLLPDWEERARRLLAEFRIDSAKMLNDPALTTFVDELRAGSGLFAQEWDMQTIRSREGGARTFLHPDDGPVRYNQHTFAPMERPDYKLVTLIPFPPEPA